MVTATEVIEDPLVLADMSSDALFSIPVAEVEAFQRGLLQRRFAELRPRIGVVDRLASDLGIDALDEPETIASLCLPHTVYKSYNAADVDKGRFDRLTRWLGSLTALDLSQVDVAACDSLESWLAALAQQTPLRPLCSSGTGGKVSFFPRTTAEEQVYLANFLSANGGFRDEPDSGLASGEVDMLAPWPVNTGNHNVPTLFRLLRQNVYGDRPGEHVHTLGRGHWDIDVMWLTARLRAAEAKGDLAAPQIAQRLAGLQGRVARDQTSTAENLDRFMAEMIDGQRGKKVFLFAPPRELFALAQECERRGVKPAFAPDSYIFSPGRPETKNISLPSGWYDLCKTMFPAPWQGLYAMTETTGSARRCAAGHYHMPPWVFATLLDPDTSRPFPREGVQTGRLALFDLQAVNYWGGTISGDKVTIDWRGDCACGRLGPFVHDDVIRYANLSDDDKITCAKSPAAYERAVEFVLGQVPD